MDYQYRIAIDKAIAWIKKNFNPVGIIISGSIVRENPDSASDLDIFVIHMENFRQRIQKYFENVPCEIFVNNFERTYQYFKEDHESNRPITAHMIATGIIELGAENAEIKELVKTAKEYLSKPLVLTDSKKILQKYVIASMLEDANDVKGSDPVTGLYFLNKMVNDIVDYFFLVNGIPLPRQKERLSFLEKNFPDTGKLINDYFRSNNFEGKYEIAGSLVYQLTGEHGFFEWQSEKEYNDKTEN